MASVLFIDYNSLIYILIFKLVQVCRKRKKWKTDKYHKQHLPFIKDFKKWNRLFLNVCNFNRQSFFFFFLVQLNRTDCLKHFYNLCRMEVFQAFFFSSEWTSECKFSISRLVFISIFRSRTYCWVFFTISMLQIKYDHL